MELQRLFFKGLLWRGLYLISFFIVNVLIARFLGAEASGTVFFNINLFSLCLLLLSFSSEAAVSFYASGNKIATNTLINFSLLWSLITGIIMFLYLYLFNHPVYTTGLMFKNFSIKGTQYVFGIMLINFFTGLFYAKKNYVTPNLALTIVNVLLALVFIFYKSNNQQITDLFFAAFLIQGILLSILFTLNYKEKSPAKADKKIYNLIFKYSFIAYLGNIVFFLVYKLDYWFVENYCNKHQLGNYIQVSKLSQMLIIIPQIFSSVIFPQTARGTDKEETRHSVMVLSRLITAFYIIIFFVVILTGKKLFPAIFGETFNDMYIPMLLLIPGIWALSIMVLLAAYFAGNGQPKVNVYGGLISVIVVIAGNMIFTKIYGMYAAAIISSLAYAAYFLFLAYLFKKQYHVSIKSFVMMKSKDVFWMLNVLRSK